MSPASTLLRRINPDIELTGPSPTTSAAEKCPDIRDLSSLIDTSIHINLTISSVAHANCVGILQRSYKNNNQSIYPVKLLLEGSERCYMIIVNISSISGCKVIIM